jgi:hypothetical protein
MSERTLRSSVDIRHASGLVRRHANAVAWHTSTDGDVEPTGRGARWPQISSHRYHFSSSDYSGTV